MEFSSDELVIICEGLKKLDTTESEIILRKIANEIISRMQSKKLKEGVSDSNTSKT